MATRKKQTKKEAELQTQSAVELAAEAGAEELVAGAQALELARGLARDAAGELAAGASDLTRAEDVLLASRRVQT